MAESPTLAFEVKNLDEAGYIEGVAAAYGNIDFGGDRILPGAARKSLEGKAALPMLMYHDQKRPVGKWAKFTETESGLVVEGKISTKTRDGGEAYELVKDGALSGLSVGYKAINPRRNGNVRELSEITVHEVSLVTIGMNPMAGVLSVKDILGDGELPSLREFEKFLCEAGFSNTQAKAIAGKGLSSLIQCEAGAASEEEAAQYFAALNGR